jgi:hypothetical protein
MNKGEIVDLAKTIKEIVERVELWEIVCL